MLVAVFGISLFSFGTASVPYYTDFNPDDSTKKDNSRLKFPIKDKKPYDYDYKRSRVDLQDPDVLNKKTE